MSLKVRLFLGAAAPLVMAAPAIAQVSISTATTAPVATATVNSGAPADIVITNTGSITLGTAGQTGVTVNSNNNVTTSGVISSNNLDGTTGILIQPGFGSTVTVRSSITLTEDYTPTDTDSDGDTDGPLAQGSNRFGIRVAPGGAANGTINLKGGTINVEGNNSAGISIESAFNGRVIVDAAVAVVGDNARGVDFQQALNGDAYINSSVTARGQGAQAVRFLGDVSGQVIISGAVTATGFTSTSISNYADPDLLTADDVPIAKRRDADDLYAGGPALQVRGNLGRGLLINGAAIGGVDPTPDIKDVTQNFNEDRNAGSVTSFGSGAAIDIRPIDGGAGTNIVLSPVRESVRDLADQDNDGDTDEILTTFDYTYGFMNRGTVSGNGLNIGFAATGINIAGSDDGTHTTTVAGGVYNSGTVLAQAFEENSTALRIGPNASTPTILNLGTFGSIVNTETNHTATGVKIEAGANVGSVVNNGAISASVRGWDGNAIAFQDLSGTVTSFTNTQRINASHVDDDTSDTITSGLGSEIAVDLSHALSGITFTQNDTSDNARIFGDILLGAGNDTLNILSGAIAGDVDFGSAGADALTVSSASLVGDIRFRGASGAVTVNNRGFQRGAMSFANGGSLSVIGDSAADATLTAGAPISITLNNGRLAQRASTAVPVSTLSATANSDFGIAINNARITGGQAFYNVAGTATLAADTSFVPIFEQVQLTPFTVRVLNAGTLTTTGPVADMIDPTQTPYLYNLSLAQNGNAIDMSLAVKTAQQLNLTPRQATSYSAVLDLLTDVDAIGAAVSAQTTEQTFKRAWNDLLPASDAAIMQVLSANNSAAFGAAGRRLELVSEKPNAPGGAWLEEFGVYHEGDETADSLGVSGGGFGVAGGFDLISSPDKVFGAYVSIESIKLEEDDRNDAPFNAQQTAVGLYGGYRMGQLALNAAGAFGFVDFDQKRKIEIADFSDTMTGKWKGNTLSAGLRATYTLPLGFLDVKPFASLDHLSLKQKAHLYRATNTNQLNTSTTDADSNLTTAAVGANFIAHLGGDPDFSIDPELSIGYRSVLSYSTSPGQAQFRDSPLFDLAPGGDAEDAVLAGLGLSLKSEYLNLKAGYDAQITDTAVTHYGSVTLRLAFW